MSRAGLRVVLAACAVLALGCDGERWATKDVSGLLPALGFTLIDERGRTVTAERYRGRVTLVYFGFTHCPDVCPVTLARLDRVLDGLPGDAREAVQVLFVSVDPARDTPAQLASYTDAFARDFIGLTGDQAQLRRLTRRYRVTYGYGEPGPEGDYPVSHSSGVWIFDRELDARLLFRPQDSDEALAADLRRLLASPSAETRAGALASPPACADDRPAGTIRHPAAPNGLHGSPGMETLRDGEVREGPCRAHLQRRVDARRRS